MNIKRNLKIQFNLDIRILTLVTLGLLGLIFWASTRVGAQNGTDLDTNNPAAQKIIKGGLTSPEVVPPSAAPEPGMLPDTNMGWIKLEELGVAGVDRSPSPLMASPTFPRHFYLTASSYTTITALTACLAGYHMATLWEILDVTSLIYDYDLVAAEKKADSGWGPPSSWYGWVRTGNVSSNTNTAGTGNCLNWTSSTGTNYGVSVRLSKTWEGAPGDIFVWDATSFSCNFTSPVWCVKD